MPRPCQAGRNRRRQDGVVGPLCAVLLCAVLTAPAVLVVPSVQAQTQTQTAAPAKTAANRTAARAKAKSSRAARKAKTAAAATDPAGDAFPQGIAAASAGRHDDAIRLLTAAISGGKLKHRDLARALYLRGASYKATKKVALAIADLTNALYMRNGLTGDDRKQALALRAASYAEGGLSDQGQQDPGRLSVTAQSQRTNGTTSPGGGAATAPPAAVGGAWRTSAKAAPASPPPRVAAAKSGPAPRPPAAAPARTAVVPPSETATTTRASWHGGTTVAAPAGGAEPAPPPRKADRTRTASVAAAPVARAVPRGLMIQAAAVRREADAQRLAQKTRQSLGGRDTFVDSAALGNMGTFYRVLVGPFAKEADSREACASLRKSGLDCLIIKR